MDMKFRKEEFVTGHTGSEHPFEVLWICTSIVWGGWFYLELFLYVGRHRPNYVSSKLVRLVIEALVIWLPMIVAQTRYLYPYGSWLMLGELILASVLGYQRTKRNAQEENALVRQHLKATTAMVEPQVLRELILNTDGKSSTIIVLDVRSEKEYANAVNKGGPPVNEGTIRSYHVPLNMKNEPQSVHETTPEEFATKLIKTGIVLSKATTYITHCTAGNTTYIGRGARAAAVLRTLGYTAYNGGNANNIRAVILDEVMTKTNEGELSQQKDKETETKNGHEETNNDDDADGTDTTAPVVPTVVPVTLEYVTLYRSAIYYLTFVAILAVDFPLFPRRFCKTEVYGYGLMDVGAASFVISSGIMSGKSYVPRVQNSSSRKKTQPVSLWKPIVKALPLLLIGMVRIITNQEIDYQEHVTEYGVHWNFFFTLGVLAVLPILRKQQLLQQRQPQPQQWKTQYFYHTQKILWFVAPFVLMIVYQILLSSESSGGGGLQTFIETAPRILPTPKLSLSSSPSSDNGDIGGIWMVWVGGIVAASPMMRMFLNFFYGNREGILGCIGYMFVFACGELIGHYCIFNTTTITNRYSLGWVSMLFWILHLGIEYVFELGVSRRSTNLSFCIWSLANNITLLWMFQKLPCHTTHSSEPQQQHPRLPLGMTIINKHGLVAFLLANILTGLINITIPTIDIGDTIAVRILFGYIVVVSSLVLFYDQVVLVMMMTTTTKQGTSSTHIDSNGTKLRSATTTAKNKLE